MNQGILLYGPPAAGKDTVTDELAALDPRYVPFTRLKVGSGNTKGYRMGTLEQLGELEAHGDVLYRNDRYGNTYVVDWPGLDAVMKDGCIPILHLGQVAGVEAVASNYPARWSRILLWCSRDTTALRSKGRGDGDTDARLTAWDATDLDLTHNQSASWHLRVDTEVCSPADAARQIDHLVRTSA
ncbi:guanylate kinase [Streptomyces abikoensis]|uniref:guanylate kinase n=1 Tax=Streptomyces abikoensis TaxID=97398 RepID=UPI0016764301|nr:guanylate kinase [Streptomyces abikoensis]GGP40288.1 hypothetical protein GCM10010214_12100 [Streptomyces abikoensis]